MYTSFEEVWERFGWDGVGVVVWYGTEGGEENCLPRRTPVKSEARHESAMIGMMGLMVLLYTRKMREVAIFMLAVGLFAGGVILLYLKIPFWSLLLGIGSVQVGIVLMIVTFDFLIRRGNKPLTDDYKSVGCVVCGAPTFVPKYTNVTMCDNCQVRAVRAFKAAGFLVFTVFTLAGGVYLAGQNQNIAEQAAAPTRKCETGVWTPPLCQCGLWLTDNTTRVCEDGIMRTCRQKVNNEWRCE